jgi:hypothetical protein
LIGLPDKLRLSNDELLNKGNSNLSVAVSAVSAVSAVPLVDRQRKQQKQQKQQAVHTADF